jgi:YVTN family beta-propeller protein
VLEVSMSPDPAAGTEVAGYRIVEQAGSGGMGVVYRAEETGLGGRPVALKLLPAALAGDPDFRARFLREMRVAAAIDHPNIVPIYRAGEDRGLLYLAMRYVHASDLRRVLETEGRLDPGRTLAILDQVARALDAAHARGLVHRDVKPGNILLAPPVIDGDPEHVYLVDFGLARSDSDDRSIGGAGSFLGTPRYAAPEQAAGRPVDGRADGYALGCVLYECLTGQSPFPRATDVALLWAHVHEEPTPPSKARPELPRELDTVLARALAKEPGRRYRSAGELIAATRSALRLGDAPPVSPVRSRTRVAIGAVVSLLAVAAVAAFVLTRDSGGVSSVSPDSVGVIDPSSSTLVAEVPVGRQPEALATGGGSAWATNVDDESVSRIDPANLTVRAAAVPVGQYPSDVLAGSGSIWVALGALAELTSINPEQETATRPIPALGGRASCGPPFASLAVGAGAVWFVCRGGQVGRVDLRTRQGRSVEVEAELVGSSSAILPQFEDVVFGLDSLWILDSQSNSVVEVDPLVIQKQTPFSVGQDARAIAASSDSLWVANYADDTVTRLHFQSPGATPVITTHPVGDGPVDVAFGEGAVWVVNQLDRSVTRIDAESGDVVKTIEIGNEPQRVAAGEGYVWVTVRAPESDAAADE